MNASLTPQQDAAQAELAILTNIVQTLQDTLRRTAELQARCMVEFAHGQALWFDQAFDLMRAWQADRCRLLRQVGTFAPLPPALQLILEDCNHVLAAEEEAVAARP